MKTVALLTALAFAAPASAETFRVSLGGKSLGQLVFSQQGRDATLSTTLDNTPLGVFNGTFRSTSRGSARTSRFAAQSKSSRKSRVVEVDITDGRATATRVTPTAELTEMSSAASVPAGVMDPVQAIGQIIRASRGCPKALQLYDGRRVVSLQPVGAATVDGTLVCDISYRVIAGPGHLSPLRISSAKMQVVYTTASPRQRIERITISSGIFGVTLGRTD